MTEKPPWRVAIEQFERSIGAPLEEFVKTDEFADMAARAAKSQAQIQHEIGTGTAQWLHAMGLPTATDVAELRSEIAELRKEVRSLAQGLAPARPAPTRTAPARTAQVKKTPTKKAPAKKTSTTKVPAKRATSSASPAAKRTQTARGPAKSE